MKKWVLILPALVVAYYVFVIAEARIKTTELFKGALRNHNQIKLSEVSEKRLDTLLKIQDPNFFRHGGTDFSNRIVTTVTQSLVKKLYFEDFRPGLAKIKQMLIARFALDTIISKKDQLTLFVNIVYMGKFKGREIVGFENASLEYFGKRFIEISDEEFLKLVAMLVAPNQFNVIDSIDQNKERVLRLKMFLDGKCKREGFFKAYLLKSCKI